VIVFVGSFIALLCLSAPIIVALGGCSLAYALIMAICPSRHWCKPLSAASRPSPAGYPALHAGRKSHECGGITPVLVNFARLLLDTSVADSACHDPSLRHLRSDLGRCRGTAVAIGVVMIRP